MRTIFAALLLVVAFAHADDYQVQFTPGGAYVYDMTPKAPARGAALDAAIIQLQIAQAMQPVRRITDITVLVYCGVYSGTVTTYSDGSSAVENVYAKREAYEVAKFAKLQARTSLLHLIDTGCNERKPTTESPSQITARCTAARNLCDDGYKDCPEFRETFNREGIACPGVNRPK